jgi:hypothetical protein
VLPRYRQRFAVPSMPLSKEQDLSLPRRVLDKAQFYRLYEHSFFGNKLRTFASVDEYLTSDYRGPVTVRYGGSGGGVRPRFLVSREELPTVVSQMKREGFDSRLIKLNESAPDDLLVLQGELMLNPTWYVRYSKEKTNMRAAMKHADIVQGLAGLVLLESVMTPSSLDDIRELLTLFSDSVIEFGVYEVILGEARHRNTVIWEVRNY